MRTKAIIIKKQNTNEFDQQITAYTANFGKLTAIAKSVLKHTSIQGMHLDGLNLVEFELISGRGMPIISAAQAEKTYINIKSSPHQTAFAYFFLEVVDRMVYDNQKDEQLWDFYLNLLENMEKDPLSLVSFRKNQLELLDILGYTPQFESCTLCGVKDSMIGWALSHGLDGIICGNCFLSGGKGVILKPEEINLLKTRELQYNKPQTPFKSPADTIFETIAGSSFSSLKFIYQCFN